MAACDPSVDAGRARVGLGRWGGLRLWRFRSGRRLMSPAVVLGGEHRSPSELGRPTDRSR